MSFDAYQPGDFITASGLNSRFATIVARIDGLPADALQDAALDHTHRGTGADVVVASFTETVQGNIIDTRTNPWVADDSDTMSASTAGTDPGWGVVGNSSSDALQTTWTGIVLGMAGADRIAAAFVRANVEVLHIRYIDAAVTGQQVAQSNALTSAFGIQISGLVSGVDTWKTLPRTVRHLSATTVSGWDGTSVILSHAPAFHDVPLATLVTAQDLTDLGMTNLTGIRVVSALCNNLTFDASVVATVSRTVYLGASHMTVLHLHAGDV
jgi:hypothetical protein